MLLIGQVPLGADPEMLFRRFDVHPVELGDHVVDVGRGHIGIGSVRHFMLRVIHGSLRPIERAPSQPWEIAGPFCRSPDRSEEHTSELQSLMRISYAVFCLTKKKTHSQ